MEHEATKVQRQYRMRKRLDDVEETRRKIVEAAVELHGTVGPAHTTFSAVADKAGVQRSTLYRHYPDEAALFGACTSHWLARNPWPRAQDWADLDEPAERMRRGLGELYGFYDANRTMISNSLRDIEVMPTFVGELMQAQIVEMRQMLIDGWDRPQSRRLGAAIAHAVDFRAWSSLDDAGLRPDEAAALMADMVTALETPG